MDAVRIVVALLVVVAAGLGPATLGLYRSRAVGWAEWLGAGFIVGLGVIGTVSVLLMIAGVTIGPWVAVALAVIGLGTAIRFWPRFIPEDRRSWPAIALACAAASILIANAFTSRHLHGDGSEFWALKGKSIAEHGTFRNAEFNDLERRHRHAGYPLVMPSVFAWFYASTGDQAERAIRLALALVFLASLPVMAGFAREKLPGPFAWWLVAAFAWAPAFARPGTMIVEGYADYPLGMFLLLALVAGRDWLAGGRWEPAALSALLLACVSQTKNEGGGFAAVAMILFPLFGAVQRGGRGAATGAIIAAPGLALFIGWSFVTASFIPDPEVVRWGATVHGDRLLTVWHRLIVNLGKVSKWGVFWYAALLVGIAKRPHAREPESLLAWAGAGCFAVFIAGWLLQPADSGAHAMGSNAIRLILQAAPTVFVWTAWRLASFPALRDWGWRAGPLPARAL